MQFFQGGPEGLHQSGLYAGEEKCHLRFLSDLPMGVHCANTALQIVQSTHTAVQFYHLRQSSLFGLWAVRDVYNVEKSQPLFRANEMFQ